MCAKKFNWEPKAKKSSDATTVVDKFLSKSSAKEVEEISTNQTDTNINSVFVSAMNSSINSTVSPAINAAIQPALIDSTNSVTNPASNPVIETSPLSAATDTQKEVVPDIVQAAIHSITLNGSQTDSRPDDKNGFDLATSTESKVKPSVRKPRNSKNCDSVHSLVDGHTAAEQKIYEVMYDETISHRRRKRYFSWTFLANATGIKNERTIRRGIDGLIDKKAIEIIGEKVPGRLGTRYQVYPPREIYNRRKQTGIVIDPQSKKIESITD